MVLAGFHEQFGVINRPLEPGAKLRETAVEIIVRQQAKDRDAQSTGRGNQSLRNATAHLRGSELVVSDEIKRVHDARHRAEQPEQRRECYERAEHPLTLLRVFNFVRGPQLHRAQERAVRMGNAFVQCRKKRIARVASKFMGIGEPTLGNRLKRFLQRVVVAASPHLPPPKRAFDDDTRMLA